MNTIKIKLVATIAILAAGLMPVSVFAAQVNFEPASLALPQTGNYSVTLLLDTEGESLNTIEGTILVNSELGDVVSVTDSGSVITYWVSRPEWNKETRLVEFSGAVPGGYNGKGILFTIVLPAYSGAALPNLLQLVSIKAFHNDGLGTPAHVKLDTFAFGQTTAIDPTIQDQLYVSDQEKDNIPPEVFSPQVARDERVFAGKWFINFATQDKQSGIDHYEIQETRSGRIDSGKWKVATSPHQLEDQELHNFIYVIAIDRQGNERVIKVFPRNPLPWHKSNAQILISIGIALVIAAAIYSWKRKHRAKPL